MLPKAGNLSLIPGAHIAGGFMRVHTGAHGHILTQTLTSEYINAIKISK